MQYMFLIEQRRQTDLSLSLDRLSGDGSLVLQLAKRRVLLVMTEEGLLQLECWCYS